MLLVLLQKLEKTTLLLVHTKIYYRDQIAASKDDDIQENVSSPCVKFGAISFLEQHPRRKETY